jgi:hypothetical protein
MAGRQYAVAGTGANNQPADVANLMAQSGYTIRLSGIEIGFTNVSTPWTIPGAKYILRLTSGGGTFPNQTFGVWTDGELPTTSASYLLWGSNSVAPSVQGILLYLPIYYKGTVSWYAKRGKEFRQQNSNGFDLQYYYNGGALFNFDFSFQFEE